MKGVAVCIALLVLCIANGRGANESITLPSGNTIEVLSAGRVNSSKDAPVYAVKYQTSLNLDDTIGLRREMDLVWARFIYDVELLKLTTAVISATEAPQNRASGRSRDLILSKVRGKWGVDGSAIDDRPGRLTEGLINQTIQLWDTTTSDLNLDGTLLYLAPDWTCTMTGPGPNGNEETRKVDWRGLESMSRKIMKSLAEYTSARENTHIEIAPDGQSATVTSKITEKMTGKDGRSATSISETSDILQLANGQVLVKSSEQIVVPGK